MLPPVTREGNYIEKRRQISHTNTCVMSSSRKRKAPDAAPAAGDDLVDHTASAASAAAAADAGGEKPLVWATKASLKEMRNRLRSVVSEATATDLAGTAASSGPGAVAAGRSRRSVGGAAAPSPSAAATAAAASSATATATTAVDPEQEDPATTAYLRAFQNAVADKVQGMCEVQDPSESREEDKLFGDVIQCCDDVRAARARLAATRARVARLSAATCSDALRISQAADDRACSVLEASTEHARMEKKTGCPLPLTPGPPAAATANGSSSNGGGSGAGGDDDDDDDQSDNNDGGGDVVAVPTYSGVDASVLEPKVSKLIGKLSELPGPLKALLQEIPELTASLSVSVQNVEAAMRTGNSRAEALLRKAPPTPLPGSKKKGKGAVAAAGGADDERPPPEEVRSAAREARVGQAKKQWQAEGVGMVGGIFN